MHFNNNFLKLAPILPFLMTTYAMPALSSLELMLENLRQLENNQPEDAPPPLPIRPVSKSRPPSQPRKALLPSSFQGRKITVREAVVESVHHRVSEGGDSGCATESAQDAQPSQIDEFNDTKQQDIQGILVLQRCFRGYQARFHYNELKSSVIMLQSFIRGENARKAYQHLMEKQKANIEMQKLLYLRTNEFERQNRAIEYLQSGIRGWLNRRHYKYTENKKIIPDEKSKVKRDLHKNNADSEGLIQIPYSYLVDLKRRVLKTEAAVLRKKEENAALQKHIKQYEKKWQEYEAKMNSMEKVWQDQLTSMQISLAASKKSLPVEKIVRGSKRVEASTETPRKSNQMKFPDFLHQIEPQLLSRETPINHLINHHNFELNVNGDGDFCRGRISNGDGVAEFQKLEYKFDAWKKEYKIRLSETKAKMKKLENSQSEKSWKRWWRTRNE